MSPRATTMGVTIHSRRMVAVGRRKILLAGGRRSGASNMMRSPEATSDLTAD